MTKQFPIGETLEEWFMRSIREEIPEKTSYSEEDLIRVAKIFFGYFEFDGDAYIGINALLQQKYGILTQKAVEIASKHQKIGKKLLRIPEFAAAKKEKDEFKVFCIKYFGYDPHEQKFINNNEANS